MGRWFGYRRGYGDLVRIWMTAELETWFFDLATVEAEIRQQIARYEAEDLTPEELPVKIRTHPAMVVTTAAKMQSHIVTDVSYGKQREQTILFHHKNQDWLGANIAATAKLFETATAAGHPWSEGPLGGPLFRNVPVDLILAFLNAYQFHERSERLNPELLSGYIKQQNKLNSLLAWNVAVITDGAQLRKDRDIGGIQLNLITRSRIQFDAPYANIKALVSRIDRAADVPLTREEIRRQVRSDDDGAYSDLRDDYLDRIGLLCIYPISKRSAPRPSKASGGHKLGRKPRLPLEAVDDVIGVGLFFPGDKSNKPFRYDYISADVSGLTLESDEPDINQLDHEDEQAGRQQEAQAKQRGG